jgi:predicted HTH domain antitoxin
VTGALTVASMAFREVSEHDDFAIVKAPALRYTSRRSNRELRSKMATRLVTKSIRLTEEEAGAVQEFVVHTGEVEAAVLKRAMLRGFQELRIEQAILAYLRDSDSEGAAQLACLPRARFLDLLAERGIPLLTGPSTVRDEVAHLAEVLGSNRLRKALVATEHVELRG